MKEEKKRPVMIVLAVAVLPYQKERLREISKKTKRSQSELVREGLGYLFSQYKAMGY